MKSVKTQPILEEEKQDCTAPINKFVLLLLLFVAPIDTCIITSQRRIQSKRENYTR